MGWRASPSKRASTSDGLNLPARTSASAERPSPWEIRLSRTAAWLLSQIQAMYRIEARLRDAKAGPKLRQAVRSSETRMILERLFKALVGLRRRELPGNAMAKALDYCLERREGLSRFLDDGRIEIDSNLVENAIRPCALGRRNWLFIGHPGAGGRAAILYPSSTVSNRASLMINKLRGHLRFLALHF